ncbi:MAG TPA: T9SS type A sorting domain-containing protein, partial [Paludibacter sp.]|nr:T9SS type A sorting domain-containing protein [Paludibacter sp.]
QLIQKYKQNAQSNYVTTSEHYQTGFWVQKNTAFEQEPGIPIFNNDSTRIEIYTAFNSVSRRDIYTKNNGCWIRSNIIDDACNYVSYAKGRGLIHSSSGCWLMSGESLDQVYYKKGAETGGTPLILTGNEELNARYSVNIYPNPTTDKIYIDLNDNIHCTFELFDAQGKFMLQKELNQKQNSVNMQEFNKGMYFYRVKTDEKQVKTGKIFRE